jgi:hypothetical protein
MYSARQRDLRERRLHAARESEEPLADDVAAIQIEDASDAEVAVPMSMPLRRGATAA